MICKTPQIISGLLYSTAGVHIGRAFMNGMIRKSAAGAIRVAWARGLQHVKNYIYRTMTIEVQLGTMYIVTREGALIRADPRKKYVVRRGEVLVDDEGPDPVIMPPCIEPAEYGWTTV